MHIPAPNSYKKSLQTVVFKTMTNSLTSFQVVSCGPMSLDFGTEHPGGQSYGTADLKVCAWCSDIVAPGHLEMQALGLSCPPEAARAGRAQKHNSTTLQVMQKHHLLTHDGLTCPCSYGRGRWPHSPPRCTHVSPWRACSCGAFSRHKRS